MAPENSVDNLFDKLRRKLEEEWPVELTPDEGQLLIGLRQLEIHTSRPVSAWLDEVFKVDEFAELADSDMVALLVECSDYVNARISSVRDEAFQAGWSAGWSTFRQLLLTINEHSFDGRELAKRLLVLQFASVALRIDAEFVLGGTTQRSIISDENRLANSFLIRASNQVHAFAIPIDLSKTPAQFLLGLDRSIGALGWFEI